VYSCVIIFTRRRHILTRIMTYDLRYLILCRAVEVNDNELRSISIETFKPRNSIIVRLLNFRNILFFCTKLNVDLYINE